MWVAAVAGDGVDCLHVLGPQLEQQLMCAPNDLVLVHARPQHAIDLVVDRVDKTCRLVEERDLLCRLDLSRVQENLRAVGDLHARALQRLDRDEVGHVDSERLVLQAELPKLVCNPLTEPVGDPGLDRHRAAHRRDARAEVLGRQPGGEELMVARRRAEVPQDRIATAWQEREPRILVARPLADVRARYVPDVVRIEQEHGTELRPLERGLRAIEAVLTQPRKVDPLLPVHRPGRVGRSDGPASHRHSRTS